jgi:putative membrane protein
MQRFLIAALSLGVGCFAATAEDKSAGRPMTDEEFVTKAASGGMFEVESSKAAKNGAASAEVKKFADKMIADHTKANQELLDLAKKANLTVPTKMTDDHQKLLDRVKGARGQEFDPAYLDAQVKAHTEAVALFENASKGLKNADLKAFAEKTLPALKDHLAHVQKMTPAGK